MQRLLSFVGALLVLFGIGLLIYVGITYARQVTAPGVKPWTDTQQKQGRRIASGLAGTQKVAVPRTSAPTAPGPPAVRIVIPRIAVDARVIQTPPQNGVWNVADWAVGHLSTTPNPGAPGNGAYAAHNDIKGELFKRLGELQPGNQVLLYTATMVYRYVVTGQKIVDPSNISVLAPTKQATVTLITCTPYWVDTQRLIVQGILTSSFPA